MLITLISTFNAGGLLAVLAFTGTYIEFKNFGYWPFYISALFFGMGINFCYFVTIGNYIFSSQNIAKIYKVVIIV